MLTGDKLETAENIGESCQLLKNSGMDRYRLSDRNDVKDFCNQDMVEKKTCALKQRCVRPEGAPDTIPCPDPTKIDHP
jgi:magnesium-transporting ATPase (P-type)